MNQSQGRIQGNKIKQNKKKYSYQGSRLDPQTLPVQGYWWGEALLPVSHPHSSMRFLVVSFSLPRKRLNKRPNLLVGVRFFLLQTKSSPGEVLWVKTEMVMLPTQRKERETRPIFRYTQKSAQSSLTLWVNQKETLFETPHFARKDLEHLLVWRKETKSFPRWTMKMVKKTFLKVGTFRYSHSNSKARIKA